MSVPLPATPSFVSATPRLRDFGGLQSGQLGGPDQRINRLGNRWALDLVLPTMTGDQARAWASALSRALSQGALFKFPQPSLVIGAPGAPVVNGAGQSGSSLAIRGFTAAYGIREGQFFSIVQGGRRYLHQVAQAGVAASGGGLATLTIEPMLRISPADGAVCEFAVPYIEGFLSSGEIAWDISVARLVSGVAFSIGEAR